MERLNDDIIDAGDAVVETRGDAQVGRDDTATGQKYLSSGIDQDD